MKTELIVLGAENTCLKIDKEEFVKAKNNETEKMSLFDAIDAFLAFYNYKTVIFNKELDDIFTAIGRKKYDKIVFYLTERKDTCLEVCIYSGSKENTIFTTELK